MIAFRDRTCGECAWHRSLTYRDVNGSIKKWQCINAACRLAGINVPLKAEACPAFAPTENELADSSRELEVMPDV